MGTTNATATASYSVRIDSAEASYGTFLFDDSGAIALVSDWGNYGHIFSAFGGDICAFLAGQNADYLIGKLAPQSAGRQRKCLTILINEFIAQLPSINTTKTI